MKSDPVDYIERTLPELRSDADPAFRTSLRIKVLNAAVRTGSASHSPDTSAVRPRVWKLVTLLVLFSIMTFFATPIGRALAQELLQLGIYLVTDEPSDAERWIVSPTETVDAVRLHFTRVEPGEVNREGMAGFPVYYPTYLPTGYRPQNDPPIELVENSNGNVISAEVIFEDMRSGDLLYLKQYPVQEASVEGSIPLGSGDASVEVVSVNGSKGLWFEGYAWGIAVDPGEEKQLVRYNLLVWTWPAEAESNMYFWLGSEERLSMDELLQVADSMVLDQPEWE